MMGSGRQRSSGGDGARPATQRRSTHLGPELDAAGGPPRTGFHGAGSSSSSSRSGSHGGALMRTQQGGSGVSGARRARARLPAGHERRRNLPCGLSSLPLASALALALAAALLPARAAAGAAAYNPTQFNKVCRYSARGVPAHLFKAGLDGGLDYLFPLEAVRVVDKYERPWEACFGGNETYDMAAIKAGLKLPCRWEESEAGAIDYEEIHACDILLKTNCYCFALDRFVGSYCEPGLGGTGKMLQLPVTDCTKVTYAVIADGGKPADRDTVLSKAPPQKGHYIALAVKRPATPEDTGDFHFWRLDSNGVWSYKAGDTLVRNTLKNGMPITDIEKDRAARGIYKEFCGYFYVDPASHKLMGNQFWFSHLPSRFNAWREHGVTGRISPLPQLPAAWLAAYHQYFADSGWEDLGTQGPPVEFPSDTGHSNGETDLTRAPRGGEEAARRKEAAFVRRGGPHWYSVRQPR